MTINTIPENHRAARDRWLRALRLTATIGERPTFILPILIEQVAAERPAAMALIGETGSLSYQDLANRIRRYAGWALRQHVGHGDVVCLLMANCPEYMAIWLGITRIGGVVALVNPHLAGPSLIHAINAVKPKHIIVGAAVADAVEAVRARLTSEPTVWVQGAGQIDDSPTNLENLPDVDGDDFAAECPSATLRDRALLIYTSGTTGLPKAANVSHFRLVQWSLWFAGMMNARPDDRMYNCLPMYHSIGGVVAPGALLVSGGSVVVRARFSTSGFWDDVVSLQCTVFQYIGELCRYLVNSPPHPREADHHLRLSCGNGLRPDVWHEFRRRFCVPEHLEFYAATEANFSLYNCEAEPGSVGRIPPFLAHRFAVALVKFDVERGQPVRDAAGFCTACGVDECGEAISRIAEGDTGAGSPFEGYTDALATEKKVLRNVFAAGDAWFRSGDLMSKDARGFFYFIDRIGDTFRWKGENVSTTEVAEAISGCPGVCEAVLYGVPVPHADGRAGMTMIVVTPDFDLAALRQHLAARLPEYARPLFVRVSKAIAATTTFKHKKQEFVGEGFDPKATADAIYLSDRERDAFVRLDPALYAKIAAGEVRL